MALLSCSKVQYATLLGGEGGMCVWEGVGEESVEVSCVKCSKTFGIHCCSRMNKKPHLPIRQAKNKIHSLDSQIH